MSLQGNNTEVWDIFISSGVTALKMPSSSIQAMIMCMEGVPDNGETMLTVLEGVLGIGKTMSWREYRVMLKRC